MDRSGCTLSSAIASYLAQGYLILDVVKLGNQYVYETIENYDNRLDVE